MNPLPAISNQVRNILTLALGGVWVAAIGTLVGAQFVATSGESVPTPAPTPTPVILYIDRFVTVTPVPIASSVEAVPSSVLPTEGDSSGLVEAIAPQPPPEPPEEAAPPLVEPVATPTPTPPAPPTPCAARSGNSGFHAGQCGDKQR